jgi:hypothetical protein
MLRICLAIVIMLAIVLPVGYRLGRIVRAAVIPDPRIFGVIALTGVSIGLGSVLLAAGDETTQSVVYSVSYLGYFFAVAFGITDDDDRRRRRRRKSSDALKKLLNRVREIAPARPPLPRPA